MVKVHNFCSLFELTMYFNEVVFVITEHFYIPDVFMGIAIFQKTQKLNVSKHKE